MQNSISVLPRLKNIYSSNTFSLMITWDVCNTMGSKHRTYSSVSSQSWPKWPFMLPGEANSMGGPCRLHHLLPVPHLLMSMKRALVGSIHCFLGHIPGWCWGLPSSSAPQSIFESVTLTHLPFNLSCPLESFFVLLVFLFSSSPFSAQRAWRFGYGWASTWL